MSLRPYCHASMHACNLTCTNSCSNVLYIHVLLSCFIFLVHLPAALYCQGRGYLSPGSWGHGRSGCSSRWMVQVSLAFPLSWTPQGIELRVSICSHAVGLFVLRTLYLWASVHLFVCLSVCLSVHSSFHLSAHSSVCLSACLSLFIHFHL